MRATLLLLTTCCALAAASGVSAADAEFQLAPHAGEGHLRIDIPQRAALTPDTFGAGVTTPERFLLSSHSCVGRNPS
jgi:hypothetical protein